MTGAGRGGKTVPLGHKEPISCDTERGVVVEPAQVATFKVAQPQFLFQLFIIPFDDPAVFGRLDQILNPTFALAWVGMNKVLYFQQPESKVLAPE